MKIIYVGIIMTLIFLGAVILPRYAEAATVSDILVLAGEAGPSHGENNPSLLFR